MDVNSITRCTPRQAKTFVTDCLVSGLVPFLQSSPGLGKSSIMRSIAKEWNLAMIDHRLSTSAPEDMTGLPRFNGQGQAEFVPFAELFPVEDTPLPEGKDGWFLFLDEFNSAPKSVQAASYKLILDRMVGQKRLHERVVIACAGNLSSDRAIVNSLSTAMQSRVVHLEMQADFDDWLYDVALPQGYDKRIIAFLSQYPSKLMDFRPDHNDKTFCCPRTWEFLDRLVRDKEVRDEKAPLYAGTITSGVAVEFIQFSKVFEHMITVPQILKDPEYCPVPTDTSTRWAVISSMMEKVTEDTFDKLSTYANRFTLDFRVLFFRAVMIQHPHLRHTPPFAKAMQELSRYLNS